MDAFTLPWEDVDAYAFPPTAILGKVGEKLLDSLCKRLILIAPGWPNMPWFCSGSSQSAQPTQSADTALQSDPSQKSDKSKSPCLAPRATKIKEQGFSEAVAARIEAPQRSTRSVYETKWTIFAKSHNTFTQFYLKDVAWADSELFYLGPVVAAQQIHHQART